MAVISNTESAMDLFKHRIDEVLSQVNQLEQRVDEIEQFYTDNNKKNLNNSKASSNLKDKDKGKQISSINKQQQDAANTEAFGSRRMQELLRQFGTILRQISQHKWAWPFMEPVDVEGLGLHDYYEVIEKPMDFSTIKKQLEAKDSFAYKHVREAYADVRLTLKNAMKYNDDEESDIHIMAKTLMAKFEEKWLLLVPKVIAEEKRMEEAESDTQQNVQLVQESAYAKLAKSTSDELLELDMHLDELRDLAVQNCRKMSTEEKRQLSTALTMLSTEDLNKALEIVAQGNPAFQATAEEVDLDIDALSETTLWRLKFFVKGALQTQGKPSTSTGGNNNNNNKNNSSKRKLEICNSLRTTKKRSKKVGP